MTISYQGKTETAEGRTLAELMSAKGVDTAKAIVEAGGEIYAPGSDLGAVALTEGMEVNVFRVVAAG